MCLAQWRRAAWVLVWGVVATGMLAPKTIVLPFARHAHGVEVPAGARLVFVSGQIGLGAGDSRPEGVEARALACFSNCPTNLAQRGMGPGDVGRIDAFVTGRQHMAGTMTEARRVADRSGPPVGIDAGHRIPWPAFMVEVEVTAARAGRRL